MLAYSECQKQNEHTLNNKKENGMKLFKLDRLYDYAKLSKLQQKHIELHIDKDKSDEKVFLKLKQIQDDIENFVNDGKNIYIYSNISGNGKTSWAIRLIQSYFDKIWYKSSLECKALFIHVPKFLNGIKRAISEPDEYSDYIQKNVLKANLVVWDEIGIKTITPFEHDCLLELINARIDEGKSNIYTSNLNPEELKEKLGNRLYSRIVNGSIGFEFKGADKRNQNIE